LVNEYPEPVPWQQLVASSCNAIIGSFMIPVVESGCSPVQKGHSQTGKMRFIISIICWGLAYVLHPAGIAGIPFSQLILKDKVELIGSILLVICGIVTLLKPSKDSTP